MVMGGFKWVWEGVITIKRDGSPQEVVNVVRKV